MPGCEGGTTDESYSDYCIQDPNADPTPVPTIGVPTVAPTVEPSVSSAPSKAPSAAPSDVPTLSPFGTIEYVGNEGIFYSPYPLGICKGDCDTNEDVSLEI